MTRLRRVYHESVAGPGALVRLEPEEAHHVAHVLRLRPGEALSVFDGRGEEWDATVRTAGREGVEILVGEPRADRVEPQLAVTLYQGLCRPDRMEWVIQKATEIGACAVQPVLTRRGDERPPSPERLVRWRRIAREAAKQSGRRSVPRVGEPAAPPAAVPAGILGLLFAPSLSAPPPAAAAPPAPRAAWLLVGPEGGLEPEEVTALLEGGWRGASLGPRTLRTETAGVVACALVLHAWGDLGRI